jgi:hypothetical protein
MAAVYKHDARASGSALTESTRWRFVLVTPDEFLEFFHNPKRVSFEVALLAGSWPMFFPYPKDHQ